MNLKPSEIEASYLAAIETHETMHRKLKVLVPWRATGLDPLGGAHQMLHKVIAGLERQRTYLPQIYDYWGDGVPDVTSSQITRLMRLARIGAYDPPNFRTPNFRTPNRSTENKEHQHHAQDQVHRP